MKKVEEYKPIVEQISTLYRQSIAEENIFILKIRELKVEIEDQNKVDARTYLNNIEQINRLEKELELQKQYSRGISAARESVFELL